MYVSIQIRTRVEVLRKILQNHFIIDIHLLQRILYKVSRKTNFDIHRFQIDNLQIAVFQKDNRFV